jgi:hypothetical protein
MDYANFCDLRRGAGRIDVLLNWARFEREGWRIRSRWRTTENFTGLYTAWYRDLARVDVSYQAAGAKPMSVAEVAARLSEFSFARQDKISALRRALPLGTISLRLAVYRVGKKSFVLLDGNHRAVAALMSGMPATRLCLDVVYGPRDADALPDLIHWTPR